MPHEVHYHVLCIYSTELCTLGLVCPVVCCGVLWCAVVCYIDRGSVLVSFCLCVSSGTSKARFLLAMFNRRYLSFIRMNVS